MYTPYDETHICNVMRLMKNLLGEDIQNLSRDELNEAMPGASSIEANAAK